MQTALRFNPYLTLTERLCQNIGEKLSLARQIPRHPTTFQATETGCATALSLLQSPQRIGRQKSGHKILSRRNLRVLTGKLSFANCVLCTAIAQRLLACANFPQRHRRLRAQWRIRSHHEGHEEHEVRSTNFPNIVSFVSFVAKTLCIWLRLCRAMIFVVNPIPSCTVAQRQLRGKAQTARQFIAGPQQARRDILVDRVIDQPLTRAHHGQRADQRARIVADRHRHRVHLFGKLAFFDGVARSRRFDRYARPKRCARRSSCR